jgi:NADH-ubiquinone oxidoreductase chain 1
MIINFISVLMIFLIVLIRVGFLTLFERKILSYIQLRKGPNKVGFIGVLQPFRDAIKLFIKEVFIIIKSNYWLYYLSPILILLIILVI